MKKVKISHELQMWLCALACIGIACCGSYAMIDSGSAAATTNHATIVSSNDSIKDKIIEKQKKMIELQDSIISQTMDHLWFDHECELGICDSYEFDTLTALDRELGDLYNKLNK